MVREDASQLFAEFAAGLKYEEIPKEVITRLKNLILDTTGVMVAASTQAPEHKSFIDLVLAQEGKKESSIIAYGYKVPSFLAAFANGSLGHGLDYDDVSLEAGLHTGIAIIPAALATAEHKGKVSGKELLTALAVACEIHYRMALSTTRTNKTCLERWFQTPLFGVFSSAVCSSRILGLNKNQIHNAFGIAHSMAGGSKEMGTGGTLRATYAAFPGQGGVLAGLMAERGITSHESILEGKAGLMPIYFNGEYNRDILVGGLGKEFLMLGIGFKPWPACARCHSFIDAALQLVEENNIAPQDVAAIKAYTDTYVQGMVCDPIEQKRKPANSILAKFSLPFSVATAITRRKVEIGSYTAEGLKDNTVLGLAAKVDCQVDPDCDRLEIKVKKGKTFSKQVPYPLGTPQKPLKTEHIEAKFRDCMKYSVKPLKANAADKMINLIRNLENADDATEIMKWVTP